MQLQSAWCSCTTSCFYLCQKFYHGKNLEKDQTTRVAENLQKKHFPFISFKPVLSEDRIEQQKIQKLCQTSCNENNGRAVHLQI